jgi:hypothetical protein
MTQEQFLNGTPFYLTDKQVGLGNSTYYFNSKSINKQIRSSVDDRVVIDDFHTMVTDITPKGFLGWVYIFNKHVQVRIHFKDLVPYDEPVKEIASDLATLN